MSCRPCILASVSPQLVPLLLHLLHPHLHLPLLGHLLHMHQPQSQQLVQKGSLAQKHLLQIVRTMTPFAWTSLCLQPACLFFGGSVHRCAKKLASVRDKLPRFRLVQCLCGVQFGTKKISIIMNKAYPLTVRFPLRSPLRLSPAQRSFLAE